MSSQERIRLGVSHLVWGFDLSNFDRMKVFLDEAAEIGYQGIVAFDTSVMPWLGRAAEFKAELTKRNLQLVGIILRPGIDFIGTDNLCKFIAAVGGEILIMSGRCGTEANDWQVVLPVLQRHAAIAKQYGVKGVYHHHTDWIAETFEQTERLLADTDPTILRAMLDCGHATKDFGKRTAAEFFHKYHERIDYVEFKDFSPASDLRTEVGRGLCDWKSVAAALRQHSYKGWVVVEQNGTIQTPKASAAESFNFVRSYLEL